MFGERPHQDVQSEQSAVSQGAEMCGRTTLGNAAEESVAHSSPSLTKA